MGVYDVRLMMHFVAREGSVGIRWVCMMLG